MASLTAGRTPAVPVEEETAVLDVAVEDCVLPDEAGALAVEEDGDAAVDFVVVDTDRLAE